jgi:ribosomal RNA-processing protein 9
VDRDIIAQRLQEDVAESKGKVYKRIADYLSLRSTGKQIHHKNPVTCVCLHGVNLYTACKNGVIEKWDITDLGKPRKAAHIDRIRDKKVFKGHTDDVLSMTLTSDGKFLTTGGTDKRICIWQTSTMTHLKTFTQHRGPIMVPPPPQVILTSRVWHAVPRQINFTQPVRTVRLNSGQ